MQVLEPFRAATTSGALVDSDEISKVSSPPLLNSGQVVGLQMSHLLLRKKSVMHHLLMPLILALSL